MNLIPKTGHILISPIATPTPSAGVIQLAEVYDIPETTGVIVAVAEAYRCPECGATRACELAEGDLVLFPASAGSALTFDGERYLLMPEDAILAVLSEGVEAEVSV